MMAKEVAWARVAAPGLVVEWAAEADCRCSQLKQSVGSSYLRRQSAIPPACNSFLREVSDCSPPVANCRPVD